MKATGELEVGLHPSDLELSADGGRLFVANSNSDSVSVIDTAAWKVQETINVRPDDKLPFGSISNALALSPDGRTLLVANGGNNAVAVVALATAAGQPSKVRGFIPTGWFPGGVCTDGKQIYIANVKGEGSHTAKEKQKAWNSRAVRGSISRVEMPDDATLARYTAQVVADARIPQTLRALEAARERRAGRAGAESAGQAVADRARRLRDQGEPHLRPGFRRPAAGQQRSQALHVRPRDHAQPSRPGRGVRAPGQLLLQRRRLDRRPSMGHARAR